MLDIRPTTDTVTADLRRIAARLQNKRPLMAALGKQLEIDLRNHFRDRDAEPNSRGFPSRHFWRGISRKTALTSVTNTTAIVTIASPELVHKIRGGTITPKRAGALSIPISPEAYKAGSASLFPRPLTHISRPGKPPLLVETGIIGKSTAWKLHYVLLKSVTHRPDPNALPPQDRLDRSLLSRARTIVDRMLRR